MTAGLVLISYAQGTNFPKIVWLGVALDVALVALSALIYALR
jgi:hypothetical protein